MKKFAIVTIIGLFFFNVGNGDHSDRGGQYCFNKFRELLKRKNCLQSMNRAGKSYDNAFAAKSVSRYKANFLDSGAFSDVEEAVLKVSIT